MCLYNVQSCIYAEDSLAALKQHNASISTSRLLLCAGQAHLMKETHTPLQQAILHEICTKPRFHRSILVSSLTINTARDLMIQAITEMSHDTSHLPSSNQYLHFLSFVLSFLSFVSIIPTKQNPSIFQSSK